MTKHFKNFQLKLSSRAWSAMMLIGGLCAGQAPVLALADEEAGDNSFNWLTNTPENGGIFNNVTKTVKDTGASAYQLFLAVGIIGLLFSIILVGFSFATNKNAAKKEENKSHLLWIAVGGIIIFGAMAILSLLQNMGSNLKF